MKKTKTKEISYKGLIMRELFLDQPTNKEREKVAEKICKIISEKILTEKFQHNHKTIDEQYDCGCAWRNDVIDEIYDDLNCKRIFIEVIESIPEHKHQWKYYFDSSPTYKECEVCGKRQNNY